MSFTPANAPRFRIGVFSVAGCMPFPGLVFDDDTVIALNALAPLNAQEGAALRGDESIGCSVHVGQCEHGASESSFYRVLKAASKLHHRGQAKKLCEHVVTSHCAAGPNQICSWDITWMPAAIKGQ